MLLNQTAALQAREAVTPLPAAPVAGAPLADFSRFCPHPATVELATPLDFVFQVRTDRQVAQQRLSDAGSYASFGSVSRHIFHFRWLDMSEPRRSDRKRTQPQILGGTEAVVAAVAALAALCEVSSPSSHVQRN